MKKPKMSVVRSVIQSLNPGNVEVIFGYPCGQVLPVYGELYDAASGFYEDFSKPEHGSNPILIPSQTWELGQTNALRWGSISYLDGKYYLYYTNGADPTSDIGRAISRDMINWKKYSKNPVINLRIGPSMLKELDGITPVLFNDKYWMLTMKFDGSMIELRSAPTLDSNSWNIENENLIIPVPDTWHDNYVFTTSFVREKDSYYIVMQGRDKNLNWNVGFFSASSPDGPYTDRGILLSPTLSWEGQGIIDPEMRKFGDIYYLFYTGNTTKPTYHNSYATSPSLEGPYTKSQIRITPISQSYPAILLIDSHYYILTDDHTPPAANGKNLYIRKDLKGTFSSIISRNRKH